ncbi:phage major capsid protein [Rhodopirellula europaea]|uniref:phage major capsid protein n=1 Tax=Rhodopirellula europaea TaxID=1263866 RepID=UPI003D2E87DA
MIDEPLTRKEETTEQRKARMNATNKLLDQLTPGALLGKFSNAGVSYQDLIPRRLSEMIIEQIPRHGVVRRFGRTQDIGEAEPVIRVMKSLVPFVQHKARRDNRQLTDIEGNLTTGIHLNPNIDFVMFSLTLDLIEDARDLMESLAVAAARALAAKEDQNAFVGDESQDSGFTLGICNALKASSLHEGGDSAANVVFDDFLQTQAKLPEFASNKPRWYMSRAFYTMACLRLYGAAGAGMVVPEDADGMLLNHPVNFIPGMPGADATTGAVPAVFGHLELATALGYDGDVRFKSTPDWDTDEARFMAKQWTDFRVWDAGSADETKPAGSLVGLKLG